MGNGVDFVEKGDKYLEIKKLSIRARLTKKDDRHQRMCQINKLIYARLSIYTAKRQMTPDKLSTMNNKTT